MSQIAPTLSIGQVAERTGLSVHTLRYYEREGVFARPIHRGPDGHRAYTEDDLEWLDFCTRVRSTGMPLAEIRRYAGLVRQGPGNEPERLAVLRAHHERVISGIEQLIACRDMIAYKVGVYEEHLAEGSADRLWSTATASGPDPRD